MKGKKQPRGTGRPRRPASECAGLARGAIVELNHAVVGESKKYFWRLFLKDKRIGMPGVLRTDSKFRVVM